MTRPARFERTATDRARMLEVLGLFRIVFQSVRRHYQSVERRTGIGGAQLWALSHIAEHPRIRIGDLARALAIHQSTASNLVRDLENDALVDRKRVREDQRAVQLCATRRGVAILNRAPRPFIGVLQQALSDLSPENLLALHRQLEKLVVGMHTKNRAARTVPLSEI